MHTDCRVIAPLDLIRQKGEGAHQLSLLLQSVLGARKRQATLLMASLPACILHWFKIDALFPPNPSEYSYLLD